MESYVGSEGAWKPRFVLVALGLIVLVSYMGCGGISENEAHEREMVAAGKASFRAYCAGCHGPNGQGNGPAAEQLTVKPANLTKITERYGKFPDDVIFERIDGYRNYPDSTIQMMPAWGNIWRGMSMEWETPQDVRERINQIVAYLKTIQDTSS